MRILGCCGFLDFGDFSVELATAHHGEENVKASARETNDYGVVSFAFCAFSFIELPGTLVDSDRCKRRLTQVRSLIFVACLVGRVGHDGCS